MLDPDAHIADMDKRGIDVEIVSSCTVMAGCEWADPRTDLALNQRLNDANAQAQQAHSGRVLGSITLPLQAPDLALRELVRAADELGLRVVNMPPTSGARTSATRRALFQMLWAAGELRRPSSEVVVGVCPLTEFVRTMAVAARVAAAARTRPGRPSP